MSGYDQFFKAAKKQNRPAPKERRKSRAASRAQSAKRKKRSDKIRKTWQKEGLFLSVSILGLALGGIFYLEEIDQFSAKIDIGLFGQAKAQASNSQTNSDKKEESSSTKDPESAASGSSMSDGDGEELNYLSKLRERKQELDQREQALVELEKELQDQKAAIDKKIKELTKVRDEIASVLKERIEYDDERIAKLVDFYSSMKPQQAAKVFEDINEDLAVEVLGRMKKKSAADIMNLLNPDKAQVLSEKFAGYQQSE